MISGLEFKRQVLHLTFGAFLIAMLYFGFFNIYYLLGILILGVILSQLCKRYHVPLASWVMDNFERKELRKTFPGKGPIYFMIGSIIVVYIFPLDIALAAMTILAVGDATSHVFGKLLSRRTYKYLKSIEGTIAGIIFSFLGALIFVDVLLAFWASLITMIAEDIKIGIEDNLFIPVLAAIVMILL